MDAAPSAAEGERIARGKITDCSCVCLSVPCGLSALCYARHFTKVTRREVMGGAGAAWGRSVGR